MISIGKIKLNKKIFKLLFLIIIGFSFWLFPKSTFAQTSINIYTRSGACLSNELTWGNYWTSYPVSGGQGIVYVTYSKCASITVNGEQAIPVITYWAFMNPILYNQWSPNINGVDAFWWMQNSQNYPLEQVCPANTYYKGTIATLPFSSSSPPCHNPGTCNANYYGCAELRTSLGKFTWNGSAVKGTTYYNYTANPAGPGCLMLDLDSPIDIPSSYLPIGYGGGGFGGACGCTSYCQDGLYYISGSNAPIPPPPTINLSAPSSVYYNNIARVSWSTAGSPTSIWHDFGAYLPSGYRDFRLTSQRTFRAYVCNAGGCSSTASKTVLVCPNPFTTTVTAMCTNEKPVNRITWTTSSGAARYRVYRYGTGYLTGYITGNSYDDASINTQTAYSYRVDAYPADYTCPTSSNITSATSYYCTPPRITNFSANPQILFIGQESTLNFSATNVTGLKISNTDYSWSNATPTNKSDTKSLGPLTTSKSYTLTATNPCPAPYCYPDTRTIQVYVSTAEMEGAGDVFSGKDLSDPSGKIRFDKRSVLSAANNIDFPGTPEDQKTKWTIPTYDTIMWGINQQKVNAMIEKIRTSATTASISGTFSGNWILNNDGNNPRTPLPTGGTKYPDGKVWVVSGDLTFDNDVSFSGRGTIIVNGNLNIQRSVRYLNEQTDFVGIIADNITIGKDSNGIVGAYYTNGTIEMLAK